MPFSSLLGFNSDVKQLLDSGEYNVVNSWTLPCDANEFRSFLHTYSPPPSDRSLLNFLRFIETKFETFLLKKRPALGSYDL